MAPPPYHLHTHPLPIKKRMMANPPSPKPVRRRQRKPRAPAEPGQDPRKRSSVYRGVTKHRYTGRFEAHLWDKSCVNPTQNKRGKQVYLGAYDDEAAAARTYDLASLKYWGPGPNVQLNFPEANYAKEYEEMQLVGKDEYLASLRRNSNGFSRGASKYRGVAKHHNNGRWEARIGRVVGNKYLYLGTYETQEEAAVAYDLAAIECRGLKAVTNFDISRYTALQPQPQQLFGQQPLFPEYLPPAPQQLQQVPEPVPELQVPDSTDSLLIAPTELPAPAPVSSFQSYSNVSESYSNVSDTIESYSSLSDPMEDVPWTMYVDSNIDAGGQADYRDLYDSISFDDVDIDRLFEGSGLSGADEHAEANAAVADPNAAAAADAAANGMTEGRAK